MDGLKMDGWRHRYTDGWMKEWMMDGWIDCDLMYGWVGGLMDGLKDDG